MLVRIKTLHMGLISNLHNNNSTLLNTASLLKMALTRNPASKATSTTVEWLLTTPPQVRFPTDKTQSREQAGRSLQ